MNNFLAKVFRMKNINRWQLMRTTQEENLSQHSAEVAMITHMIATIANKYYGCSYDINKVTCEALFHDVTEVITGDMPTPIKYANEEIRSQYKQLELQAADVLVQSLPEDFRNDYLGLITSPRKIVKAADKIAAYLKCVEEVKFGNSEFVKAKDILEQAIKDIDLPEVDYFMENCVPAFSLTLDEL